MDGTANESKTPVIRLQNEFLAAVWRSGIFIAKLCESSSTSRYLYRSID